MSDNTARTEWANDNQAQVPDLIEQELQKAKEYRSMKLMGAGVSAVGFGLWRGAAMSSVGKPIVLAGAIVSLVGAGGQFAYDPTPKTG